MTATKNDQMHNPRPITGTWSPDHRQNHPPPV